MKQYKCRVVLDILVDAFEESDVEDLLDDYFGVGEEGDIEVVNMKVTDCEPI